MEREEKTVYSRFEAKRRRMEEEENRVEMGRRLGKRSVRPFNTCSGESGVRCLGILLNET
jgi:hypothetical protein